MSIENELIAEILRKLAILENSDNQRTIREIENILHLLNDILSDEQY